MFVPSLQVMDFLKKNGGFYQAENVSLEKRQYVCLSITTAALMGRGAYIGELCNWDVISGQGRILNAVADDFVQRLTKANANKLWYQPGFIDIQPDGRSLATMLASKFSITRQSNAVHLSPVSYGPLPRIYKFNSLPTKVISWYLVAGTIYDLASVRELTEFFAKGGVAIEGVICVFNCTPAPTFPFIDTGGKRTRIFSTLRYSVKRLSHQEVRGAFDSGRIISEPDLGLRWNEFVNLMKVSV